MLRKLCSIIGLLTVLSPGLVAQELNCKVKIQHDKITGVDNSVYTAMERALNEFMNSHRWTTDDFGTNERIDCQFVINLISRITGDNDGYNATITVQASRPVFNSNYQTTTVNFLDKDVIFDFSPFAPLQFEDNNVTGTNPLTSNLTAVMAYYAYLIIGLDYDSFASEGGTAYLKKAQNVVNNAPEQGKSIPGWKAIDGTHNRYWIIDQLLNTRFEGLRKYWYSYHREGLDNMYNKPEDGRKKILAGIRTLSEINRENPSSVLVQFFFNAKNDELAKIVAQIPQKDRGSFITLLSQMDVPDAAKYNSLK